MLEKQHLKGKFISLFLLCILSLENNYFFPNFSANCVFVSVAYVYLIYLKYKTSNLNKLTPLYDKNNFSYSAAFLLILATPLSTTNIEEILGKYKPCALGPDNITPQIKMFPIRALRHTD